MGFVVIDGELVHTSRLGDDMQDSKTPGQLANWAACKIYECGHDPSYDGNIAHIRLTITTKDGHKHDYMQGEAGGAGIDHGGEIVLGGGSVFKDCKFVKDRHRGITVRAGNVDGSSVQTIGSNQGAIGQEKRPEPKTENPIDLSKPTTGEYRNIAQEQD